MVVWSIVADEMPNAFSRRPSATGRSHVCRKKDRHVVKQTFMLLICADLIIVNNPYLPTARGMH